MFIAVSLLITLWRRQVQTTAMSLTIVLMSQLILSTHSFLKTFSHHIEGATAHVEEGPVLITLALVLGTGAPVYNLSIGRGV